MNFNILTHRFTAPLAAASMAGLLLSGCAVSGASDAATRNGNTTEADSLQISESWIKAAGDGMTGAFAVLENTTDRPSSLVKVDSPLAGSTELHDMEGSGTAMTMKELDGPLEIPAHSTIELAPGGKHVMLMDLKQELKVGQSPALRFTFGDGSTREVPFEIKSFTGAKESYAPEAEESGHPAPTEGDGHAGH